jgi:excisionase family DNA binding protein
MIADAVAQATSINPPAGDSAVAVSLEQAAERLHLSPRTIRRLIASGELPSVVVGDRRLVRVADLESFIDSKATG